MLSVVLAACGSSATEPVDGAVAPALTADEAVKACVVYGSCMGDGINDCYTDAMPFWTTSEARCTLAAGGDCAAVRACFGMTAVIDASCTTRVTSCDGANLVICGSGVRSTIACPKASLLLGAGSGPTCVPASNGSALCGTQACSTASATCHVGTASSELEPYCGGGAACYPTKGSETCTGNAVAFCAAGTTATIDCTTLGFSSCVGGKCF